MSSRSVTHLLLYLFSGLVWGCGGSATPNGNSAGPVNPVDASASQDSRNDDDNSDVEPATDSTTPADAATSDALPADPGDSGPGIDVHSTDTEWIADAPEADLDTIQSDSEVGQPQDVDAGPDAIGADADAAAGDGDAVPIDIVAEDDVSGDDVADTASSELDAPGEPVPDTNRLWLDVILPSCAGGSCHLDGQSAGGLNLDLDTDLQLRLRRPSSIGMPIVTPGDPSNSYLWLKVAGTHRESGGSGVRMPLGGFPLRTAQLEQTRRWIEALPQDK